jgi:RNA-directed DNA polymerase
VWTSFTRESGDPYVFPRPKGKEERAVKGKSYKAAMYGIWKSDNNIVPEKPANKKAKTFAEQVEGRTLTEENTLNTAAVRTQRRGAASIGLQGVRRRAQQDKCVRFNNLFYHITTEPLTESFYCLKKKASAGVDEMTWHEYKEGMADRITGIPTVTR